jgi:hypothetical protein
MVGDASESNLQMSRLPGIATIDLIADPSKPERVPYRG